MSLILKDMNMGGDILGLYSKVENMQVAYIDFNAVEKVTNSVERWSMLKKLCNQHKALCGAGASVASSAETSSR